MYAETIESSPRTRHGDNLDTTEAPQQPPQKLRLMYSYGGHIVPRPHDKKLCYVGGETRIIVIERRTSLFELQTRLSKTLPPNQIPFWLKYQIPNEDLDSLISLTTDEDLENMVEEYDRLNNAGGGSKPGRIRLFLFLKSSSCIEQQLVETGSAKSDDWFFNALNGKTRVLSGGGGASDRGGSESSSISNLLGLDEDLVGKTSYGESQPEGSKLVGNGSGNTVADHDVHSVPDSPMLEGRSSFGSASSSSVANLPPIKVRVEENPKVGALGIEDQFQQMNVTGFGKPEELGLFVAPGQVSGAGIPVASGGVMEYAANRVLSDDERSDHSGYRKIQQAILQEQVQLPQQPVAPQLQQKPVSIMDLPSPDSVSSEGSARNPLPGVNQAVYQEQIAEVKSGNSGLSPNQVQTQVQESGCTYPGQYDQGHPTLHQPQQLVHAGSQYLQARAMPIPSYYHVYAPQQQQQYPLYFMPPRGTQAYNFHGQQPVYSEPTQPGLPSRPQVLSSPVNHMVYRPAVSVPSSKPEGASGLYKTGTGAGADSPSHLVQHQTQGIGFSQITQPSQPIPIPAASNASFTPEFADPLHAQVYYSQPLPPQVHGYYQTLAPAPGAVLPNASSKPPADNMNSQ